MRSEQGSQEAIFFFCVDLVKELLFRVRGVVAKSKDPTVCGIDPFGWDTVYSGIFVFTTTPFCVGRPLHSERGTGLAKPFRYRDVAMCLLMAV